jgi:hypothetical protein
MGLLDDAIREHLDLKRRRGADPGEIEREEAEALGPVRRDAQAPGVATSPHPDEAPGLEDPGEAYAEDVHDEPRDHPQLGEPPVTHDQPYAETDAESATPPHGEPYQSTREFSSEELEAALGERRSGADRDDVGAVSASAEAEAEAEVAQDAPAGEGDDEDVLEETPDFLQETPEHDRLWFEQRPPKDFDF